MAAVLCLGNAGIGQYVGAGVDLKASAQDPSTLSTRVFWNSNNAQQCASNASGISVHRDSTLSDRGVSHKSMCSQQDEIISHRLQQQKMSSNVSQDGKRSRSHNEHFKTPVHTDTTVNRSDNCYISDAVKLSGSGMSLADSGESLSSATKSVRGKCESAVSESAVFVATPSRRATNHSAALDYLNRSEWNQSVQDARASVRRARQSRTVLEHELSTVTDRDQNCAAAARDQLMHGAHQESAGQFADENSNMTSDSFLCDDVRESEMRFSSGTSHHGNLSVCLSICS